MKQNRRQQRASVAKLRKLNDAELDTVVLKYLGALKKLPLRKRLEFALRLLFKLKL